MTKAAKRVRYKDGVLHANIANLAQGLCSGCRPTQDKIEEEPMGIFEDDCMLNFGSHSDSEME